MTAPDMLRRRRTRLLALLLAAWCSVAATGGAQADAPVRQGWWSFTGSMLTAPDVPADGLVVQGAADNPDAVAALVYPVPEDVLAATLTLQVAPQSGTVPGSIIKACPLTNLTFVPAQGGALADAPAWSCEDSVAGTSDTDSASYVFSVGPLIRSGHLGVALVGSSVGDRVVFAHPGGSSLTTVASEPAPVVPAPSSVAPSQGPAPGVSPPLRSLDPPLLPAPALTPPTVTGPAPQLGPLPPAAEDSPATGAEPVTAGAALSSPSASGDGALVMALLLTALALAGAVQRYRAIQGPLRSQ